MNRKSIKSSDPIAASIIVQNKSNPDGFVMFLRALEPIVPIICGQLLEPVIMTNKLFLMPTDSLHFFHSKTVDVENNLLTISMACPPHELLQRCLGQL